MELSASNSVTRTQSMVLHRTTLRWNAGWNLLTAGVRGYSKQVLNQNRRRQLDIPMQWPSEQGKRCNKHKWAEAGLAGPI